MNSSSGGFIEIFLGDVPPMYRDNRLRPFRLSRLACACGNSLVHDVSFGFVLGAGSSDVLQFLGIDTHPLPDTPFHISHSSRTRSMPRRMVCTPFCSALRRLSSRRIDGPPFGPIAVYCKSKDWMPNIYSGKLLARVAAIAQSMRSNHHPHTSA